MSRPFFRMHEQYSPLMSGAHRKPATSVGAPALVAHLAFWQPDANWQEEEEKQNIKHRSVVDKWVKSIDEYIQSVYCRAKTLGIISLNTESKEFDKSRYIFFFSSALDKHEPEGKLLSPPELRLLGFDNNFGSSYQSVVFILAWHHIQVTLRFEVHSEYFTITSFIDLTFKPFQIKNGVMCAGDIESVGSDDVYRKINKEFDIFNDVFLKAHRKLKDMETDAEVEALATEVADTHEYLYRGVWNTFFEEILLSQKPLRNFGVDMEGTVADRKANLGNVFADFRGLTLTPPHDRTEFPCWDTPFALPHWRNVKSTQPSKNPPFITSNFAQEVTRKLWPFIISERLVFLRSFEFTVSRMLGGRAIYITALGAQPSPYLGSAKERTENQLPLYYVAYFHTYSRWQIGRLLDRIHHLGTVRIAAIQQVRELRDRGTDLRGMSVPLNRVTENLKNVLHPEQSKEFDRGSSKDRLHKLEALWKEIIQIQNITSEWNKEFLGGILYRIERSRYYVRQFQDGLPSLRIGRVDGFQPYDVFVEHRLGATFGFIDRLGHRIERFERHLSSAYQSVLAISAIRSAKLLVEVQIAAEFFVWVIAAPYYVNSEIEHLYEHVIAINKIKSESYAPNALVISLEVIVVLIGLFVWLLRRRNIKNKELE